MRKQDEIKIQEMLTETLRDTHRNGLLQGSKAMCAVIYEKAIDSSRTYEDRIADIITFCEISLGDKEPLGTNRGVTG